MLKTLSTVMLVMATIVAQETLVAPTDDKIQLTKIRQIELPFEDRLTYVRKVALYLFKKAAWSTRFKANACPEYVQSEIIDPKTFCDDANPEPLPVTVCEVNKTLSECLTQDGEINPDCVANPRLCEPPSLCDLP